MRRLHRYCLTRQHVKMSWNPRNCFNVLERKPLNERHLNIFQVEWKSKALCRQYFNGDVTERSFKKVFEDSKRNMLLTIGNMERRVDNVLFRSLFASSVFLARKMASSGHVLVNGKRIWRPGVALSDGDVLQILPAVAPRVYRNINHPMIRLWSFLPEYLEVNFATLSTVFLRQPRWPEIPSPYPKTMIENFAAFYSKRA